MDWNGEPASFGEYAKAYNALKAENEKLKDWIKKHHIESCPDYGFCMPKIGESSRDHCAKCRKIEEIITEILKGE